MHILQISSIHTGEQINHNVNKSQTAKIALHFTERPLAPVVTLCFRWKLCMVLDPLKYEPGQNRIRTFLKTRVVFFGLYNLLSP